MCVLGHGRMIAIAQKMGSQKLSSQELALASFCCDMGYRHRDVQQLAKMIYIWVWGGQV